LNTTVEDISFINDVHSSDAEFLERRNDRIELFAIAVVLEFHGAIYIVRIVADTRQENGSALFLACFVYVSR